MKTTRRILLVLVALAATVLPASGQSGPQVVVTMSVAGTIQDQGGAYYIAFAVGQSLLAGPQPDSTNWTHYVLYRGGRFLFGTVPPADIQQFAFLRIRPPAPFLYGQVLPNRKTLRVSVPLGDLEVGPGQVRRFMVNFVTTDDANKPLHALGMGATDRFGFVTVELGKDIYVTVPAPRGGPSPDPNFTIAGGNIQIMAP